RCDSVRPICGPCSRAQRFEDCEYVDGPGGISRVRQLEESIQQVQNRIMDLERPRNTPQGSVVLQNPYRSNNAKQSHINHPPKHIDSPRLDAFSPYACEVGFFLNQNRFRTACLHRGSGYEEPPAALLNTICLWAARLSSSEPLASQENDFLSQALKLATTTLSSNHRLKILYGIQTEVLLCQYFLHKGRLVEAQYHLSLAASHVVLGDLSSIRSARSSAAPRSPIAFAQDPVEEGELIIGFWTVLSIDKIWSSVLNFPSNFASDGPSDVDTPWPLEMEVYERVCGRISEPSVTCTGPRSPVPLDMSPSETDAFFKSFSKLNARIKKFRDSLPSPNSIASCTSAMKPRIILAHTVAHAATIQLNRPFVAINPQCMELCLAACRSIVWIIRAASLRNIAYISPIIGSIWATTGQVLVEEIKRLRTVPAATAVVADLMGAHDEIVASVALFSRTCPFMGVY
ncbi:hypothetical protein FB451DRAFT_1023386, partial [Mycena latifolia]